MTGRESWGRKANFSGVFARLLDWAFKCLSPRLDWLYSKVARRSIAPEKRAKALLLNVVYGIGYSCMNSFTTFCLAVSSA